jgi:tRNA dimethylallyltransferase
LGRRLEEEAERDGRDKLHARLAAVDPKTAARLHPNDVRRVVRALEVYELTGQPISAWQQTWDTSACRDPSRPPPEPVRIPAVVLDLPREVLYDRINRRVDAMLAAGWLDEVRRLRDLPRPLSREARQALGYRELLAYLDDGGDWDATVDLIRTRTRQFAKRQLTWFRHLPGCVPVAAGAEDTADRAIQSLMQNFRPG